MKPFNIHTLKLFIQKMVEWARNEKNLSDDWELYGWKITNEDALEITLYNKHLPYEDFDREVIIANDIEKIINS
jgi:hypothetical protein